VTRAPGRTLGYAKYILVFGQKIDGAMAQGYYWWPQRDRTPTNVEVTYDKDRLNEVSFEYVPVGTEPAQNEVDFLVVKWRQN
jgi:hypothetical protein